MFFAQECQSVALVGLGGVGKTQVALQLAYWVKEHRPEYSIFWIPVLSRATFEEAYVEMGRRLLIQNQGGSTDIKVLIKRYLSSTAAGPWLVIIDNADDGDVLFGPNGLSNYLPESEHGLILFTTRSREVAIQVVENNLVELGGMDRSEALKFLEKSLIRKDLINKSTADELLAELTDLPLAISQAAAYLNKNQLSISEYLRLLRSTEANMISLLNREFRDNTRYKGSQNAIATTWLVSFEQIRATDSVAADLLSFISYIEPKAIPQSILPHTEVEEHLINAIGTLCGYTFLVRRGNSDIFDMHSLVHVAVKVWLGINKAAEATETRAITHLEAIFKAFGTPDRHLWRSFLPHALHLLFLSRDNLFEVKANLFQFVGWCLNDDRRFKESTVCFEMACKWREQNLHEQNNDRIASEQNLSIAYFEERRYEEAIGISERIVAIQQAVLAEDDRRRLAGEQTLGLLYLNTGRVKEGIGLLEHAAKTMRQALAEDDDVRLKTEHSLAVACLDFGQTHQSLEIIRRVVAIRKITLPEDHHERLNSEMVLARCLHKIGEVEEAITLGERVVAIRRATVDGDDFDILEPEFNLAIFYDSTGRQRKKIELMERVLARRRKICLETDDDRLKAEHNLAVAYGYDKQIAKAAQLLKHVVEVTTKISDSTLKSTAVRSLTAIYESHGHHEQAIKWQEEVAALSQKVFAENGLPV